MLEIIKIKNFAIARDISIELGKGLNVFTGETGAGKTLIINAIKFCLGENLDKDLIVRDPKNGPLVQLVFSDNSKDLIFERIITEGGKSRTLINGLFVPQKNYMETCNKLIAIHGQNSTEELFSSKKQLHFFDYYFKEELSQLIEKVKELKGKYIDLKKAITEIESEKKERAREIDFLKFQINEIEEANLKHGEEESLKEERDLLSNAQRIIEALNSISLTLSGGEQENIGIVYELEKAINITSGIKNYSPSLGSIDNSLNDCYAILKETNRDILNEVQKLLNLYDEKRLGELVDRLDTISNLKKKYGDTIEKVLESKDKMEKRLEYLSTIESSCEEFKDNLNKTTEELKECLLSLSSKRESLKEIFESKIQKELSDLSLDKAKFSISFKREEVDEDSLNCIKIGEKYFKLFEDGLERVEFLISTNPGQPLLPLTSIASGGELSRIMLAIKTILREVDQTPTLIFDEIDAGIGGIVGDKVGEKLYEISENKQVICITHLHQIASKADNHFTVWKETDSDDTSVKIGKVNGKERIIEISRMIGGDYLNDTSLKHAEEILKLNSSR